MTRIIHVAILYVIAHGLSIEKRQWGRYRIVQTKLHQHQHYGMGEIGKHEIC